MENTITPTQQDNAVTLDNSNSSQVGTRSGKVLIGDTKNTYPSSAHFLFFWYALFIVLCLSFVTLLFFFKDDSPTEVKSTEVHALPESTDTNVRPTSRLQEESFLVATNTWFSKFSIDENSLQKDMYTVIYFDRSDSQNTKQIRKSNTIFLNYGMEEQAFYKIPYDKLAVYWVGKKMVEKTSRYKFVIDSGWSSSRLIIDKKVISDGMHNREVWVTLEEGEHLIEVELLSAWHVPEISLSILSEEEVSQRASQTENQAFITNVPIWYVGIYEPAQDEVKLILPKDKGDITLVLSSYEKTLWKVISAEGTKVASALVMSYKDGSSLEGVGQSTKVVYAKENTYIGLFELYPQCPMYNSTFFYCETLDSYKSLYDTVNRFSKGGIVATFTGAYSTSSMSLPARNLSPNEREKLDAYSLKVKQEWNLFQAKQKEVN